MISVHRASDRFVSEYDGIVSRHCFSAGRHYNPDNTAFGAVIAVDEHLLAPGAGFDPHAHRGVVILSWVLDGALRHEDAQGRVAFVAPGMMQVQSAGSGIVHGEYNASADEPLRFVQTTLLADVDEPGYALGEPPILLPGARFDVHRSGSVEVAAGPMHLYVARGSFTAADVTLNDGDSVRSDEPVEVSGVGELLICSLTGGGIDGGG